MPVSLIVPYRSINTYALNVLIGAVQTRWKQEQVRIVVAAKTDDVITKIRAGRNLNHEVLVLWSFYSTHYPAVLPEFRLVREAIGGAIHLAGGPHASAEPEQVLRDGFDFAFIGEGENSLNSFIGKILDRSSVEDTKGIALMKKGSMTRTPAEEPVILDEFPPFAPLLPRVNPIEITRGCVYACSFCQTPFLFKARFRHRSPGNVARWTAFISAQGMKDIRFITPTALSYGSPDENVHLEAVENLLSSVRQGLRKDSRIFFGTFPSELRPDHVSPRALQIIRTYCDNDNVLMGAQSGSDRMLKTLHRGHDVESVRRAVRYCVEAGFLPNVDLIFGLPGERREDANATLALADELTSLGARIHGHSFMPLPGTPLKHQAPGEDLVVSQRLHKLIARGKLYGQWARQRQIANGLVGAERSDDAKR